MAASDWLFEVGVDTTKADASIKDFVARTSATLRQVPKIEINVSMNRNALRNVQQLTTAIQALSAASKDVTINVNATQAAEALSRVQAQLKAIVSGAGIVSRVNAGGGGFNTMATSADRASASIQRATGTVDWLGRVWQNTMFKFIEFQAIGASIEATIRGIGQGLQLASDVQLEQTLQKLYAPNVFSSIQAQGKALQDASQIARTWGADIRDVLQVQGLWAKQTHDLTTATYLANQAEMMHRASGIQTLEVYRDSIALATQLGVTLDKLPQIYNQVAQASLRIALPMKDYQGGGRQEAMQDIFTGLAESAATLRSVGFDTAGAIAAIAEQVQATGQSGATAARNLSAMFAALEGSGAHRTNFLKIIGTDARTTDQVLQRMLEKLPEIKAAYAEGLLGVRPTQYESMNTFLSNLTEIKRLYDEIRQGSNGSLELVSNAAMQTLNGQMAALKSNVQLLELAFGQQLLPTTLAFIQDLNHGLLPAVTQNAGALVELAKTAGIVAAAFIAWQMLNKGINTISTALDQSSASIANLRMQQASAAVTGEAFGDAELGTVEGMDAATTQMMNQKAALDLLAEKMAVVDWQTAGLNDRMRALGVTEEQLATVMSTQVVSGFDAAAGAVRGFIGSAVNAAAPLIAISGLIAGISAYRDSFDADKVSEQGAHDAANQVAGINDSFSWDQLTHGNVVSVLGRRHLPQDYYSGMNNIAQSFSGPPESVADIIAGKPQGHWSNSTTLGSQMLVVRQATLQVMSLNKQIEQAQNALHRLAPTVVDSSGYGYQVNPEAADLQGRISDLQGQRRDATDFLTRALVVVRNTQRPDPQALAAQRQQDAQDAANRLMLSRMRIGNGAQEEPPFGKPPTPAHGTPDQEDVQRHRIETIKRDSMGQMTRLRDEAAAAQQDAKAVQLLGQMYGWSGDRLRQFNADYQARIRYVQHEASAAENEARRLHGEYQSAMHQVSATRGNVKLHEKALTNLSTIEAALNKANGAAHLFESTVHALRAELDNVNGQHLLSTFRPEGMSLADVRQFASGASAAFDADKTQGGYSAAVLMAEQYIQKLQQLQTLLNGELGQRGLGLPQIQAVRSALGDVTRALGKMQANLADADKELVDLNKQASDLVGTISGKLGNEFSTIFGDDSEAGAYAKSTAQMLADVQEITNERSQLLDIEQQIGTAMTPQAEAARQQVYYASQLLTIQEQLLPLYEQIQQVRDSAYYKDVETSLEGFPSSDFTHIADTLFESHASAQWQYSGAGRRGHARGSYVMPQESGVSTLYASILGGMLKSDWTTASQSLTDAVFGISGKQTAEQQMLTAANIQMQAAQAQLQAAQMASGRLGTVPGVPPPARPQGTPGSGSQNDPVATFLNQVMNPDQQSLQVSFDPLLDTESLTPSSSGSGAGTGGSSGAISAMLTAANAQTGTRSSGFDFGDIDELASLTTGTDAQRGWQNSFQQALSGSTVRTTSDGNDEGNKAQQKTAFNLASVADALNGGAGGMMGASLMNLRGKGTATERILGTAGVTLGTIGSHITAAGAAKGDGSEEDTGKTISAIGSGASGVGLVMQANQESGGLQSEITAAQGMAQVGGAIGSAFGPAGAAIGTGAGFIAGLIEDAFVHHPNPSDEPDVYDTQAYGKFVADMTGHPGTFNGTTIDPSLQYSSLAGNLPLYEQIGNFISNPQEMAKLQPNQQKVAKQLLALEGGDGTQGLDIKSEKNGVFTLDSGKSISVDQYENLINEMQQIMQGMQTAVAPLISMNAYGAGPGATGNPMNNLYGLTAAEQQALVKSTYGTTAVNNMTMPGQSQYQATTPYGTPGVGTAAGTTSSTPIYTAIVGGSQPINITTTLQVSGQTLASIVNAINAEYANRNGTLAA